LLNQTITNFKDINNQLLGCNFAVLRYDKRTLTHPTHNPTGLTVYDFITDINAAIDFAKTLPQVDTNQILLLGHSQGTNLTPIVAQNRSDIKALVSLGTPATPIDTGFAAQIRYLYYFCLNDTATGDANFTQLTSDFMQIRNGTWPANTPYQGAFPAFWKSWFNVTDSAAINYNLLANTPVLFLHANEAFNVPLSDAQRLESNLTIPYDMYYLDGLNHYFTPMNNNKVSAVVGDTICAWYSDLIASISTRTGSNTPNLIIKTRSEGLDISLSSNDKISRYSLYNTSGQLVEQNNNVGTNIFISNQQRAEGIYIIQLSTSKGELSTKITF
jgi:pimeloyl-ACP methyl ester carboxylesterase